MIAIPLLLIALASAATSAGGAEATPTPGVPPASATPTPNLDYHVGPGDVLEVAVLGNLDLSRTAVVQTNGSIVLPLLGEVAVAQLTLAEIRSKLTNLLARDYLVKPQVEVGVKEYQSQFVTVLGEVNNPGRKPIRGRTRLLDLLLEAGGFTPRASGELVISRADGTFADGERTMRIRLGTATPTVQDQVNLEVSLRNGDLLTASQKYYVTVEGEVARPGRYVLEPDLTVTGAISVAGGMNRYASSSLKIRRTDPISATSTLLKANFKSIRNGKEVDLPLQANDVIMVGRRLF